MKTTRFYALLALLLMAEGVTMQAQEQLEVELIGEGKGYLAMLSLGEDEFLATMRGEENGTMALCRMKTDGMELEYVAQNQLNECGFSMASQQLLFLKEDGFPSIIYHKMKGDSLWIAVGDINEDLMVVETGTVLLSGTGVYTVHYMDPQFIIENDSVFAVSYFTNEQLSQNVADRHRIIRFDKCGHVLADRYFTSVLFDPERLFALNADSTGYLLGGCDIHEQPVKTRCFNLDFNLDTTLLHDEIYNDFPLPGWRQSIVFPYVAKHPVSGCLYVVGSIRYDANGQSGYQNAIIAKFDKEMSHIDKWALTVDNPGEDQRAYWKSIDFFPDGSIAMCALVQDIYYHEGFYVARFDEDLNKISEIYKPYDGQWQGPVEICAMPNGDCLITTIDDKIYHILADSFWGVDETHNNGLKVAVAYPNPGKDVLNIRTGLKDVRVEVYDMSGRMVYGKEIIDNVTAINTTSWPSGSYVWKVISNGKEAESGKWIKR
jgi:hypothetical protein